MRGLWLEDGELSLEDDLPVPQPAEGEALVRVLRAGICNTDLELVRGYYPYAGILGHEFAGSVETGPDHLLGKRVVGEINAVCHDCAACRARRSSHCERRTVLGIVDRHGAFADYLILPVENLHRLPDTISTDAATFVEPLAAALEIQEQVEVGPEHRVVVVGDGKLGQLVARSLRLTGCELLAIGRHGDKLDRLAAVGIDVGTEEAITEGGFDIAVECTGNPSGFALARSALRPRGTLVLKSTYAGELTFDVSSVVVDEITLVGSRCGPFEPAIAMLASGEIDPTPLIAARYPLDEGLMAFEHANRKGTLKVVLDVGM
ncbi:MAG: alcohol dehydrogenase catalytic domain-containing protein [Acidobacteriota bacterium]|nr:alcohol dehydrogenase catalytic domain-containing protein [Acidobacteriota bacterium]